jgi:hypothetical protein
MKGIGMKNFSGYTVVAALLATATLAGCPPREELHTEVLESASSINGKQLYFIPASTDDLKRLGDPFYTRIVQDLPTAGQLPNSTDGAEQVEFSGNSATIVLDEPVMYYGVFYNTIIIGTNGTVAFGTASAGNDTLTNHFGSVQISVLPLNLSLAGTTVSVEQSDEAVTITFEDVVIGTDTAFTSDNTFQVEIFVGGGIAGDVVVSYVKVDDRGNGIAGLANGQLVGLSETEADRFLRGFSESNLSQNANTSTR